jgi:hypothetical protein
MIMMQDWNSQRDSLLAQVRDYAKQTPDVLRKLMTIEDATIKINQLEPKQNLFLRLLGTFSDRKTPRIHCR